MRELPTARTGAIALLTAGVIAGALGAGACTKGASPAADRSGRDAGGASVTTSGLPAPPDVAAPPRDAVLTASGLASKVLVVGSGSDHPGENDSVRIDYTGWTTDGRMFDSTVAPLQPGRRPQPRMLLVSRAIDGWAEGLKLMVVGEKRRLWVPQDLAYKGRPGGPAGMLVYDLELLDFTPGPRPPSDVAAPPADAEASPDGLTSKVTRKGAGTLHPRPSDAVRVNYSFWQTDGKLLEASRDKPVVRPVTGVAAGWTEGVQQMVVGEQRTLWVPAALGPPVRPGAPAIDVTMVIELLDILSPPKTPPDVKGPPKDAVFEKDGLAMKVLAKGSGTEHPKRNDTVMVQYAGWTTDGKLFDSTYVRGQPASLAVNSVIPGWAEALQLMVEGEKRRVWVPEALAYRGQPQRPQGVLVFELELLKIDENAPRPSPEALRGR